MTYPLRLLDPPWAIPVAEATEIVPIEQPRPVFRSGVDIDAVHFSRFAATGTPRSAAACAAESAPFGAAPHSVGQRTEGGAA